MWYLTLSRTVKRFHKSLYQAELYVVDTIHRDGSKSYNVVDSHYSRDPQSTLAKLFEAAHSQVLQTEQAVRDAHEREVASRSESAYSDLGGF